MKNDTLRISINAGEHGVFEASAIKLEGGKLSFSFTPGPTVQCVLNRKDDNSFEGTCLDEGGGAGQMTMVPPKKGADS